MDYCTLGKIINRGIAQTMFEIKGVSRKELHCLIENIIRNDDIRIVCLDDYGVKKYFWYKVPLSPTHFPFIRGARCSNCMVGCDVQDRNTYICYVMNRLV